MQPTITRVIETTDVDDRGRPIQAVRVEFKLGEHGPFSVTLAKNVFTAAAANQKIQEFAASVQGLQGIK